jgi:hypothetical protein
MEWSLLLIGIIVGFVLLVAAFSVVAFRVRRNRLRALSTALGSDRKDRSYVGFSGAIALDEKSLRFAAIGEDEGALIIGADEIIEARCEQTALGTPEGPKMPYVMLTILTTNDALPNYSLTSVFRTGELKELALRLNAMRDHAKVKSSAPAITSGVVESGVPTQSSAVTSGAVESNVAAQDEPLAKAIEQLAQAVTKLSDELRNLSPMIDRRKSTRKNTEQNS